jgi:hypothetical protein
LNRNATFEDVNRFDDDKLEENPNNLPVPGKVDLVCDMFSTNEQRYTIKCPYKFKGV